jgi:protease-4
VRLLRALLFPFRFVLSLILYPFRRRAQRRILKQDGWTELWIQGEVLQIRPIERWAQDMLRKLLRQQEGPKVVMSRLRRFTEAFIKDPFAKGVLVRIGPIGGGWASSDEIRQLLLRIRSAGREVLVFIDPGAGNREMLIASAGSRVLMPASGGLGVTGTASQGLFLKDTLARLGVTMEVAAMGRFKSAPEQFTRTERSEFDQLQTEALVNALDEGLISGLVEGGRFDKESAQAMLTACPVVGTHALEKGFVQGLTHEEDLVEDVMTIAGLNKAPDLVGAGGYLDAQALRSPFKRKKKRIGIVEVHGAIVDEAAGFSPGGDRMAVKKAVVDDLRAALADDKIGAVVLHVDSRGGSVTASDAIWAAVRRVDKSKPVIACFGDISASGGYYVACGARAIIASPLTITGSIGVYSMMPTWPELAAKIGAKTDVIKNFVNAGLYNPWAGLDERTRTHAQGEVAAMYDDFLQKVADARRMTKEAVHEVAEGRVWIGSAAYKEQLLDGLGGLPEAIQRAKDEAGGKFEDEAVLVRALRSYSRPDPFGSDDSKKAAQGPGLGGLIADVRRAVPDEASIIRSLIGQHPQAKVLTELLTLSMTAHQPLRAVAWQPTFFES